MKLKTSKSGKKILKISEKEWREYGEQAGFIPTSKEIKTAKITKEAKMEKLAQNAKYIVENDFASLNKMSKEALNSVPVLAEIRSAVGKDIKCLSKLSDETVLKLIS